MILPAFLRRELRRHVESYAEPGPVGLLIVGEKGAPFRRSTFGRKWRKARETVGLPEGFRFYDLRHTGPCQMIRRTSRTISVLARIWHATADHDGQQKALGL